MVHLGKGLRRLGGNLGLMDEDFEVLENVRAKTPAEPLSFD
jgi:hypothetical protein